MTENLRLAFREILAHKMRSFLTMLGVIIGIAAIIAIVSTIKGTNEQILENLIGAGNNNVVISLRQGDSDYYMDMGAPQGVSVVTEDQKKEIRALDSVEKASFYQYRSWADGVSAQGRTLNGGSLRGVDADYLATCGYRVSEGRYFTKRDYREMHKVVLLDDTAAAALFPGVSPVGETMEIRGEPFTVVGRFRRQVGTGPVITSLSDYLTYAEQESGMVLVPDCCWPIICSFDEPVNCVVRAGSVDDMSSAGRDAAEIMNRSVSSSVSDELSYHADDLLEKARNKQEVSNSTNSLLIWIASIALLVGGIGVMNIMLVSVTERTSEIGLKKALGARKRRILTQFLMEAAVLTSLGGVLGVAAGIILAQVISRMADIPVAISIPSILLSVALSMLIGIGFGMLPSVRAANLNPIDALRRE